MCGLKVYKDYRGGKFKKHLVEKIITVGGVALSSCENNLSEKNRKHRLTPEWHWSVESQRWRYPPPHLCSTTVTSTLITLWFALRLAIYKVFASFQFHIGLNIKLQFALKFKKNENLTMPIGSFCEDCRREYAEKLRLKRDQICMRSSVLGCILTLELLCVIKSV